MQTFTLQRDAVYGALESGMTLDEIRTFLTTHGRTELPANVGKILAEWAESRRFLVIPSQTRGSLASRTAGPRAGK